MSRSPTPNEVVPQPDAKTVRVLVGVDTHVFFCAEGYERAKRFHWSLGARGHITTNTRKTEHLTAGRLLLDAPKGFRVVYKDGDHHNLRLSNLTLVQWPKPVEPKTVVPKATVVVDDATKAERKRQRRREARAAKRSAVA